MPVRKTLRRVCRETVEEGPQHRKPQEVKPGASWGQERPWRGEHVQWQSPGAWPLAGQAA